MSNSASTRTGYPNLDDPITGYRAGIVAGCRLIVARVKDGEDLDEAVDDTLDRKVFSEYDAAAYAGLCEVFSWIGSLDLDWEYDCPIHRKLGSSECPRC